MVTRDILFVLIIIQFELFLQKWWHYTLLLITKLSKWFALMSDAPAHQLFVLLPTTSLKMVLEFQIHYAIQVALEGEISKQSVKNSLSRGIRAGGD